MFCCEIFAGIQAGRRRAREHFSLEVLENRREEYRRRGRGGGADHDEDEGDDDDDDDHDDDDDLDVGDPVTY